MPHDSQVGSSRDHAVSTVYAVANGSRMNAVSAGPPPQRKHFGQRGCIAADEAFRVARARWYEKLTGRRLDCDELTLHQQFRMCDAVARAFRAFTDGRRSLGESSWSGFLTTREARINGLQ